MTASHSPAASPAFPRPAAPRSHRARRIAVLALYAVLAVQVAAWVMVVLNTGDAMAAFTGPHPGFQAGIIAGGAIWLIQFALAVVLFHRRALSRPAR